MDTRMHGYNTRRTRERLLRMERRRVQREFPDPQTEALGLSIHRVQSVVEYAHLTAGKCLEPRDADIPYVVCEGQYLAGCSSEAYNTIIFPLRSVLETLKKIEGGLESWAYKPKRMRYMKEEISRINRHKNLQEIYRISWIRNLIYSDIGRIDEFYIYTFTTFTNEIDPTIFALQYLHDTLQIICTQLEIPIPILSPPADNASTSGTETNSDPNPPSPTSTTSSASGSTLTASSSATIRHLGASINDDATDEDESETESETEDDEDEDEEMPDQPLHSSIETCTENSSINASSHGMDGAGDTFMEDLHAATGHARASSPAASNAPKPKPSTPSTPSSRKIRTISSHRMDGASDTLIEDLQAAAQGHARASSPAVSIASNAPNASPSAPSTPSSHQARPPTTPLPTTPRSPPAPSIGECIFPPKRKTFLPVLSDGYSSSSLPSNPLPPTSTPTARLYSLAFHITAQCLQQAKSLKEMGERYAELASEMGTCWEGWRGVVRRFDDVVREAQRGENGNGIGIGDGF